MDWLAQQKLSTRALNALVRLGVEKSTDLHKVTTHGLLRLRNVGRVTVREIAAFLVLHGYSIALPGWITRERQATKR